MKVNKIYVASNGAALTFSSGEKGVAVLPATKDMAHSMVLAASGKLIQMKGVRINGVGVPRFLESQGFVLAEPGNPEAAELADRVDIRDGLKLVENACTEKAIAIQDQFRGQARTFVPYNAEKAVEQVTVEDRSGGLTLIADLAEGISCGGVSIDYVVGVSTNMHLALTNGWIIGPDEDATAIPRVSEYGGYVEQTAHILCSAGLAKFVGSPHLVLDENAPADTPFAKGVIELELSNNDRFFIGVDALDLLQVEYRRNGVPLHARSGMPGVRLGEVIGAIAAVLVRVAEMDAVPAKKVKKAA